MLEGVSAWLADREPDAARAINMAKAFTLEIQRNVIARELGL